jgi:hypothetical protein
MYVRAGFYLFSEVVDGHQENLCPLLAFGLIGPRIKRPKQGHIE